MNMDSDGGDANEQAYPIAATEEATHKKGGSSRLLESKRPAAMRYHTFGLVSLSFK